jgi:hypothetical protein
MNSVFGFAVSQPEPPEIRPAIKQARSHLGVVLGSDAVVGDDARPDESVKMTSKLMTAQRRGAS